MTCTSARHSTRDLSFLGTNARRWHPNPYMFRGQACGLADAVKALSCPQVRQPSAVPSSVRLVT